MSAENEIQKIHQASNRGEVQGAISENLPKKIMEHLPEIKSIVRTGGPEQEQKAFEHIALLSYMNRTSETKRSRSTLHSGEVDFSQV